MPQNYADWHTRGCCPCGFTAEAPYGYLAHVMYHVCPNCGVLVADEWSIKIMRLVKPKKISPLQYLWMIWEPDAFSTWEIKED